MGYEPPLQGVPVERQIAYCLSSIYTQYLLPCAVAVRFEPELLEYRGVAIP
jgi:hypothetical protein